MQDRRSHSQDRDILWDHFINREPADPKNGLAPVILSAEGGSVYPVKTQVDDPATMSHNIKQLANWWGADLIGITQLDPAQLQSPGSQDNSAPEIGDEGGGSMQGQAPYRFALVCAIGADHDPSEAKGLGGQVVMQNGAIVIHYLRSYLRELGYRAVIGGVDRFEVATKAGLGSLDGNGRFVTRLRRPHVEVFEPVLTDMPLAADPLP